MLHCRVVVVAQPKNCRVPSSALLNYNYDILSTGRAEVINAAPVPANTWQLRLSTAGLPGGRGHGHIAQMWP